MTQKTCYLIVLMVNQQYYRDKRNPLPTYDSTSRVMSANKGSDTKPELIVRQALWNNGIKGYRLNYKKVPGKPDIAFVSRRLAVFINGCFWHRCPKCDLPLPKNNQNFWKSKFERTVARDQEKVDELLSLDWKVLVVWECEIYSDLHGVIERIKDRREEQSRNTK